METPRIYVSTASMYGWGSDPWKGVSYVSDEDRANYLAGALVILTGGRPAYGSQGTTLRRLDRSGDRWTHRLLTPEQLAVARAGGLDQ